MRYCSRLVRDSMSWTKFVRSKLHIHRSQFEVELDIHVPIKTIGSEDALLFRDELVSGGVSHAEAKLVDMVNNALQASEPDL